ncbi:MAG: tRNA 2-thiouridine(34) synthase MnmA [Oscillospiraceae bacterium]|nr:tRNA 2-thiouridine(34) synthase MnmA [Oscillospiraceae bacterium]
METTKMLVAMSGGVDSSVAAYLIRQAGFPCAGAIARMCDESLTDADFQKSIQDARAVARRLEMDFHVIEAVDAFKQVVVEHFIRAYEQGLTPNPCVQCNRHIKFSFLLDKALALGYDTIVTGHYAKIRQDAATGRYLLCKAADDAKDQSYFLACLNQHQLGHARFPLGEFTKDQIRKIAEEQGFLTAKKKDSQDICFIPDGDYMAFIRRYTGKDFDGGNFLDLQGNVIGKHAGAMGYTLGQRKGLGLAMGAPVYVCGKDMAANTVTVGPEEALYTTTLLAKDANWFPFPVLAEPMHVEAKARSRHIPQPATVYPAEDGFRVVFDTPQRAVTPGQTVVLYQGDMVVGSGTITEAY